MIPYRCAASRPAWASSGTRSPRAAKRSSRVWPRSQRLPKLDPTNPPQITVRVGPPVDLKYRSVDADTKRIMKALMDLLPPESREKHTPTAEELALTYPPGYSGDPEREIDRRPGTDT